MKPKAVVISGKIGSGKSTLARRLAAALDAELIKSKAIIQEQKPKGKDRVSLQRAGELLDKETDGKWLSEAISAKLANLRENRSVVIDAVRIVSQVYALRRSGWDVTHIHLEAREDVLKTRFAARNKDGEPESYEELNLNKTERHADDLKDAADTVIDTERCNEDDVYCRAIARIGTRPSQLPKLVDVLVGGQYGSEGKGNIAHHIAPDYDVLVRVGSINAGHQVYTLGGEIHTFRQLPSGALANPTAMLVLGAGAVIGLTTLQEEMAKFAVGVKRLIIDPNAMVISADDKLWEEDKLAEQIGSTAQGVGRATARKILHRWPDSDVELAGNVPLLKKYCRNTVDYFAECLSLGKRILLEGTQGTSLSLHHGFYPWVTSRATTADACLAEAGISSRYVRRIVMVCRTYPIRVGDSVTGNTSGTMSAEIDFAKIAARAKLPAEDVKAKEKGSVSGRPRRVCEFDWVQLRRSLLLNGATDLALTFVDYLDVNNRKAYRYEQLTDDTLRFIEELEAVSGIPVSLISTAFNERNIIDRRLW